VQRCAALFVVFCAIAQIGLQTMAAGGASHCCCVAKAHGACPLRAKTACAMKSCSEAPPQNATTINNDAPAIMNMARVVLAPLADEETFAIARDDRASSLNVIPEPPPPKRA